MAKYRKTNKIFVSAKVSSFKVFYSKARDYAMLILPVLDRLSVSAINWLAFQWFGKYDDVCVFMRGEDWHYPISTIYIFQKQLGDVFLLARRSMPITSPLSQAMLAVESAILKTIRNHVVQLSSNFYNTWFQNSSNYYFL